MNWNETLRRIAEAITAGLVAISLMASHPAPTRPPHPNPTSQVRVFVVPTERPKILPNQNGAGTNWHQDPEVSWYGPGFYGKRTACGLAYTKTILGVAHRTLPCGTIIEFRWKGRTTRVPVIDRGPYVAGRTWDLSGGLCVLLQHCFTGPIEWRIK